MARAVLTKAVDAADRAGAGLIVRLRVLALLVAALLAACGSSRTLIKVEPEIRHRIVLDALGQVGRPYRYGGATPEAGFDCSGLIQYIFAQSGIRIPRTTLEQRAIGIEIDEDDILPGDLLFYRFGSGRVDHVALYLGDGEAIHAPASGRSIIVAGVDMKYWRQRFVEAVRIVE